MSLASTPLVSVVIPAYNCGAYVAAAIRSVLEQDYANKEVIVINDGSTDDTGVVLQQFGAQILVIDQANAGVAAARNAGMKAARGDLIALLDADDVWLPGKLTRQVQYLQAHSEICAVYCAWRVWRPEANGEFVMPHISSSERDRDGIDAADSGWLYNRLLLDSIIHTTTLLMRRESMQRVGDFNHELRRGQDYDYWLRLSRIGPIHKLNAVLSLYRIHTESISHRPHRVNYPVVVIEKALQQWGTRGPDGNETKPSEVNAVLHRHWFDFAYLHLLHGDVALARDGFWRCIKLNPWRAKAWINWVRSIVKQQR